jgi:hypothetical protein
MENETKEETKEDFMAQVKRAGYPAYANATDVADLMNPKQGVHSIGFIDPNGTRLIMITMADSDWEKIKYLIK